MARAPLLGVFILALCLVACVCANDKVSKEEATKSVSEAQTAAKKTVRSAGNKFRHAESYLRDADANKRRAELATAEAAKAAKDNQAAEAIAKKVKDASDEALKLYTEVSSSAKDSVNKMKSIVTKAEGLDAKATAIQIVPENTDDYTKAQQSAVSVKAEVDVLDKEITAASGVTLSYDKLSQMSEFVKTAQLAKFNVDAIVAVAKIDTVLKSADDDIKLTEQKRDEISTTVQKIKKILDNSPKNSFQYVSTLLLNAEGEVTSASNAVKAAKEAKEDIVEQKKGADAALAQLKTETDLEKAKKEAENAVWFVQNAEKKLKDTKKALQSATISATNAGYRKNDAEDAISGKTRKPDATQDNKKTNPPDSANTHQPVKSTTESPKVIEPKKPTIPNPDESTTGQTVKATTESPAVIETKKPTITNPNQPGSPARGGGTEPTQPSSSDGAMTLSVPLLLALIACAALH